ncbi:MAG: ferritin [candidate division WOR-3 bacterium]
MDKNILKALNDQMIREFFSSYLYLSMAAWFEKENLKGFSKWMKVQAWEELGHAMKFFEFITERGEKPELEKLEKPKVNWNSPLEVFEDAYEHEKFITKNIHELYKSAEELNDYPTKIFLHWFIEEQVEEENQTLTILDTLKKIEKSTSALYHLDYKLSKREFKKLNLKQE